MPPSPQSNAADAVATVAAPTSTSGGGAHSGSPAAGSAVKAAWESRLRLHGVVSPTLDSRSPSKKDTLVVFDWDDTILPTSWLQRFRMLQDQKKMAPEMLRQIGKLIRVCKQTLELAAELGNVVLITNSAPGWVMESCLTFMPELITQVRKIPVFARPLTAPINSFKINTFQRECKPCKNVVSVGDGCTERLATLKLMNPSDEDLSDSSYAEQKRLKSVKLIEMPSCQELIAQHTLLQSRLMDIVAFEGSLDLMARFAAELNMGYCSLVHVTGPLKGMAPALKGAVPAFAAAAATAARSAAFVESMANVTSSDAVAVATTFPWRTAAMAWQGEPKGAEEGVCYLPLLAPMRGRSFSQAKKQRFPAAPTPQSTADDKAPARKEGLAPVSELSSSSPEGAAGGPPGGNVAEGSGAAGIATILSKSSGRGTSSPAVLRKRPLKDRRRLQEGFRIGGGETIDGTDCTS